MMIWIPRIVENRIRLIRNKKYVFLWNRQIRKRNTLMILINLFRQLIEQLIKVKSNVQHIFSSRMAKFPYNITIRSSNQFFVTLYTVFTIVSRKSFARIHSFDSLFTVKITILQISRSISFVRIKWRSRWL